MLTYLAVSNLAVFDRVELELGPGLTVVTGETGAGKSMLLNALLLLLGGRVEKDALRSGESELVVEALWQGRPGELHPARLVDAESVPDEVMIRRTVRYADGARKDRLVVADRLCTVSRMQELAADLVNISSQHEYIRLLKRSEHLGILDRFAGHRALVERMAERHAALSLLDDRVQAVRAEARDRDAKLERLRQDRKELDGAGLVPGMEEELQADISRLAHAAETGEAVQQAIAGLYEDDDAVVSRLESVRRRLAAAARFEPGLGAAGDRLAAAGAEVADVAESLRSLLGRVEADPGMLDHLQQKLSRVQKLKRRFEAGTVEDLVRLREATAGEVVRLERLTDSLEELEGALAEARGAALDAARALHASRAKAAGKLERSIARTLVELEMGKAAFRIPLEMDEALLSGTGADRVEFLFSANRGEEPRPLQKIASGGELSRVLLAFKAVLADAYPVPTYVFDEIDAGIGGKTALAVGRLLAEMAREQQVLCITHTAQLAAFADHHLVVSKTEKGGRTRATVARLDSEDAVVGELARMLSGLADSATALSHARELRTHALAGRSGRV